MQAPPTGAHRSLRHDWSIDEVETILELPFPVLLYRAQSEHRRYFDPSLVQVSTLLSIKTGGCPEDCAYCPQSARFSTGVKPGPLMAVQEVMAAARLAKEEGATRFCMGAAWRHPKDRDLDRIVEMVRGVKALGLETCLTLGMLSRAQSLRLREAGLDYYNHNLDTSPEYYAEIITTRTFDDRLQTLEHVREAGISVCCGGIVGLGETRRDRAALLLALANLPRHPESVPINLLVRVEGTPLAQAQEPDTLELVRTVAAARILMPGSVVRLSAGREQMSDELQALCFLAGANSVFYGERLLTTRNPQTTRDLLLFQRLGLRTARSEEMTVRELAAL